MAIQLVYASAESGEIDEVRPEDFGPWTSIGSRGMTGNIFL